MFKFIYTVCLAAVLTALWAIQNRTLPFRAVLAAFVIVGAAAAMYLAATTTTDKFDGEYSLQQVLKAAILLAAYQLALFAAFSTGAPLTQAAVNTNVAVIFLIDAAASRTLPSITVALAIAVQICAAAYSLLYSPSFPT